MKWLLTLLSFLFLISTSNAQTPRTEFHLISDEATPIIDGDLDDEVWANAHIISDFHQINPNDHGVPSEKTTVQIARDTAFIYIAFRAYDSEIEKLSAKGLIQGQNFFSDDRLAVYLDTFNDRRNSYFFQVNGNAIRRDALMGNDYFIDDWSTIWYAETKIHDWGWSAELAIPIKSISFDPNADDWGINFGRVYPRRGEQMAWSSQEREINRPSVAGYISGVKDFSQGLGLEIAPSLSIAYTDKSIRGSKTHFEPSLSTFYNITPNLTAGVTFNTDFSATEVDDRQVNLGRFSLFFPEKRDFFLRDASIFEFGGLNRNGRPFFSRRVGLSGDGSPLDIEAGAKLTGRIGQWNVGALAIQQEAGSPDSDESLFIGRVSRNVFDESQIGIITTVGDPTSAAGNSLVGVDYKYRNSHILGDQTVSADFWYQETDTDGFNDNQTAYGAAVDFPNDIYSGYLNFQRIEENFNPALGFISRVGVEEAEGQIRYKHHLKDSFWQWYRSRLQFFKSDRIEGGVVSQSVFWNAWEGFSNRNDFFTFFIGRTKEGVYQPFNISDDVVVPIGEYDSDRYGFFFETGFQRPIRVQLEVADGGHYGGRRFQVTPKIEWRPNKHFFASFSANQNRIRLPQGDFTSKVYAIKANYAFNSKWAWLNVAQADNSSDTLSINSRLRYQPRADREYFLVFNQTRDRNTDEVLDTALVFKVAFNFRR